MLKLEIYRLLSKTIININININYLSNLYIEGDFF